MVLYHLQAIQSLFWNTKKQGIAGVLQYSSLLVTKEWTRMVVVSKSRYFLTLPKQYLFKFNDNYSGISCMRQSSRLGLKN